MESEPAIVCWADHDGVYDDEWLAMVPASIVAIVVWVIGLPILWCIVLYGGYRLGEGRNWLWYKASEYRGMLDAEFEDRVAAHHDRRAGECPGYCFGLGAGQDFRELGRRRIRHGPFDRFFVYVADDHLGLHAGGTQRCESGG